MAVRFEIDETKCTECLRCSAVCGNVKEGTVRPAVARVRIEKKWPKAPEIHICRFDDCDKPCVASCPVEAISVDKGIVRIDRNTCTGCETCVSACPYGAIFMDADGLAFKCDFCGGDPACVKECVTGALKLGEV
jgi:Fe-S-cluster-containing dehydrogenase component